MTSSIISESCKSSCKSSAGKFLGAHAKQNTVRLVDGNRENNKSMLSLLSSSSQSLSSSIDDSNWFDRQQKQKHAKRFWPTRQLTTFPQWLQHRFMPVALIVYIIATLLPCPVIEAAAINFESLNNDQAQLNYTDAILEETTEISNDLPMITTILNSMSEEPTFDTTEVVTFLPTEDNVAGDLLQTEEVVTTTIQPELMAEQNETEIMSTTQKLVEEKLESDGNQTSNLIEDMQKKVEQEEDKESVVAEVNNDILDNNLEQNLVKNKISAGTDSLENGPDPSESLEESIRNSVKTEIAQEQNLESSPVLEILKEIPEPEIRDILREDMPIESQALEQQQELITLPKEETKAEEQTDESDKTADDDKDETILEVEKQPEMVRGSRHLEYQTTILPFGDENEYVQATTYSDVMEMEGFNENPAMRDESPMEDDFVNKKDNVDEPAMTVDLDETVDSITTVVPLITSKRLSKNLKELENELTMEKGEEEEMSNDVDILPSAAFDDSETELETTTVTVSIEKDEQQQHMVMKKILSVEDNKDNVDQEATTIRDNLNSYRSLEVTTVWPEMMDSEANPVTELPQFVLAAKGRALDFDDNDVQNEKMLMDMNEEKSDWIKAEDTSSEIKLETVLGMNDEGMETMVTTYTPSIVFRTGEDDDNEGVVEVDDMMTTTMEALLSARFLNEETEILGDKEEEIEVDSFTTLLSITEAAKTISSTQGVSVREVEAVRGRALPVTDKDNSNRSTTIIILSSGTACLFIVISMTIFMISFQRQHGTLDIELQERNCGKDNLDEEDAATFSKLLEVDLSKSISEREEKDLCETDECL